MMKRFALIVALMLAGTIGAPARVSVAAAPPGGHNAVETVNAEGAVHGEGGSEAEPSLVPALDKETLTSAIWVIIIFVLLLAVLYPTAWKQVLAGLKAR